MKQLDYHLMDFNGIWYLNIFRKSVDKIQGSIKSDKILYMTNNAQFIYVVQFFLEWGMLDAKGSKANLNTFYVQ